MENEPGQRILFIINPASGTHKTDWSEEIRNYFTKLPHTTKLFELPEKCKPEEITGMIEIFKPTRIIAVGGDGTVNFVAGCLVGLPIPLGILPAGSANGMARELAIPDNPVKALDIAVKGQTKKIHAVKINGDLSIHLSDLGFNAYVVKKFKSYKKRGMWSYAKAAWQVIRHMVPERVTFVADDMKSVRRAIMIVIANGTQYGSGGKINPEGKLDDDVFEVVVIKRVSFIHSFRMLVLHRSYDPKHTETFKTRSFQLQSRWPMHFQVDGEYRGKTNKVEAGIIPGALEVIVGDAEGKK
jgi:YegS/Rv2252/BmrU family lipid kinase